MDGLQPVTNFLVPATGSTNAFVVRGTFSATPLYQDFNNVALDGIPFRPSGVIIDNQGNSDPLNVLINEIGFQITCPGGAYVQMPYPAPLNSTANITGNGDATVVFVDYPVIPFSSATGSGGSVPNPLPVTGPLTDTELRASPVPVEISQAATVNAALTSTTTSGTVTAGARAVSFQNTGAAAATVAGGSLPAGGTVGFEAPVDALLGAIAYDATGTTLLIATVA